MAGRAIRQGFLANGLFTSWMEELSAVVSGEHRTQAKKTSKRNRKNIEEVAEIITEFCEEFHAARVEPTPAETAALWERCSTFKTRHISVALGDQLSLQNGADWQPRLRALCLLEQCFEEDGAAPQLVALKVYEDQEAVLKYLASNVQPCSEKAKKILTLCASPPAVRPKAPAPTLPVPPMDGLVLAPPREESNPAVVRRSNARTSRNPERQALLSDVGEEPQKPAKEDSETTASNGRSPTTSSGQGDDDAAKQQRLDSQEEMPFDPNLPTAACRSGSDGEQTTCASLATEAGGAWAPPL